MVDLFALLAGVVCLICLIRLPVLVVSTKLSSSELIWLLDLRVTNDINVSSQALGRVRR